MTETALRTDLQLSVVVPVHNGARILPLTLGALAASDLPRNRWELIVVDDASTDESSTIARQLSDVVLSMSGPPSGPAAARNRGAARARAPWVVFIDADVAVHPDTLSRIVAAVDALPGTDAMFGAYDEMPRADGLFSQYRNLLHRYVHLRSAGVAETFWAGCGVVRRAAFEAVGGFDEARFPRPQIEDIDLGYRLRDRGFRIVNRPELVGSHLKRWTFFSATRADLFDRGIPWVKLRLERRVMHRGGDLNVRPAEMLKAGAIGIAGLAALAALVLWRVEPFIIAVVLAAGVLFSNRELFNWFAQQRGSRFALATVPLNLWYYVISVVAVGAGTVSHALGGTPQHATVRRGQPSEWRRVGVDE